MPKFLFLQYVDEAAQPRLGTPEKDRQVAAYADFWRLVSEKGAFKTGDPVAESPASFTVRVRNGSTEAADGPLNGGLQLDGFWVLDCRDRGEAERYAAQIPAASSGAVEVRPIAEM